MDGETKRKAAQIYKGRYDQVKGHKLSQEKCPADSQASQKAPKPAAKDILLDGF